MDKIVEDISHRVTELTEKKAVSGFNSEETPGPYSVISVGSSDLRRAGVRQKMSSHRDAEHTEKEG